MIPSSPPAAVARRLLRPVVLALLALGACERAPTETLTPPTPEVTPQALVLALGGEERLRATVAGGEVAVAWTSSDTLVARVDDAGVVRAVGAGTALVTARAEEGRADAAVSVRASFVAVHPGSIHTCGLGSTGRVACWGGNTWGNLGIGRSGTAHGPAEFGMRPTPVLAGGGHRFRSLAADGGHTCGITLGGETYCWGSGSRGQLGSGDSGDLFHSGVPLRVMGEAAFVALSVGGQHTCGLAVDGVAYCWGDDGDGQIGSLSPDGPCRNRYGHTYACSRTPAPVAGGFSFTAIAAGSGYTCALSAGRRAYCWGNGREGQLGNGAREIARTPVPVAAGGGLVALTAGDDHACALDAEGRAHCWGRNAFGQLGVGGADTLVHPVPRPVTGEVRFASLSAGDGFTCGLTAVGEAYCWGRNRTGQLGNGTPVDRPAPTRAAGALRFAVLRAGRSHACGVTAAGVAYCWGAGETGQIGHGLTTGSTVPQRVLGQ